MPAATQDGDDRRLAFGRVAELYDAARPTYPAVAIDAILAVAGLGPGDPLYEVGTGTGKATVLFAERGHGVTGIEPSADMARVARARCAAYGNVEVVESDFETWRAPERRRLVASAQAWHWVDPSRGYRRAAEALVAGGTLAAMWNFPDWPGCALQAALGADYRAHAPELRPDFPMHPDSRPERLSHWRTESESRAWFARPEIRGFRWQLRYTTGSYLRLLETHQDHILMDRGRRVVLFDAIAGTIERAGGAFEMPLVTCVCTLTRL